MTPDHLGPAWATVSLLAASEHGPGRHGPVLIILVAVAVLGGLFYVVKSRRRSDRGPDASDRSPEARDASDRGTEASDASPDTSDRSPTT